ncbi:MAG: hypothetical protein N2596_00620, partial [Syntrophorhabdaceae bacterium]|nr:hypothetical protein [Syntrophorhabdaceae bacterium]
MEKMVSGMYIGEIARIILWDAYKSGFLNSSGMDKIFFKPYSLTTEQLSLFTTEGDLFKKMEAWRFSHRDIGLLKEIGRIVSKRAARIVATAIAAVVTHMDSNLTAEHTIAIDGSLFEKYSGFKENMVSMLKEIFEDSAERIQLSLTHNGSGIGAAVIAAVETLKT